MAILTSILQPNINPEIDSQYHNSLFKRKEKNQLNTKSSIAFKLAGYVRSRNSGSCRTSDTDNSSFGINGKENADIFDQFPETFTSSYNTSVESVQERKHRFSKIFHAHSHSHSSIFWRTGRSNNKSRNNSINILNSKLVYEENGSFGISPLSDSWKLSSSAAEKISEDDLTCYQKYKTIELFEKESRKNGQISEEQPDSGNFELNSLTDDKQNDCLELGSDDFIGKLEIPEKPEMLIDSLEEPRMTIEDVKSHGKLEITPINSGFSFDVFDETQFVSSTPTASPRKIFSSVFDEDLDRNDSEGMEEEIEEDRNNDKEYDYDEFGDDSGQPEEDKGGRPEDKNVNPTYIERETVEKTDIDYLLNNDSFGDAYSEILVQERLPDAFNHNVFVKENITGEDNNQYNDSDDDDLDEDDPEFFQFTPLEGTPIFDESFLTNSSPEDKEPHSGRSSKFKVLHKVKSALKRSNSTANVSLHTDNSTYSPVSLMVPAFRNKQNDLTNLIDKMSINEYNSPEVENLNDLFCGTIYDTSMNGRLNIMDPSSFCDDSCVLDSSDENYNSSYVNFNDSYSKIKFDQQAKLLIYDESRTCTIDLSVRGNKKVKQQKGGSTTGAALAYSNSFKRRKRISSVISRFSDLNSPLNDHFSRQSVKPILKNKINANSESESMRAQNCDVVGIQDFMTFFETHERRKIEAEPTLSGQRAQQVSQYYADLEAGNLNDI